MNNVDIGSRIGKFVERILDTAPKNTDFSPIWCLGECYRSAPPDGSAQPAASPGRAASTSDDSTSHGSSEAEAAVQTGGSPPPESDGRWPKAFLDDFESRIWLTYRKDFPPIPKSQDPKASSLMTWSVRLQSTLGNSDGFTSDQGWGCMIRSGQSLLANTLLHLRLGREWRRGAEPEKELGLLSLFADDPKAPFSIHRFVEHGASACGKHPGEWFGPSATARCIQALCNDYPESGLRVYLTGDGSDVYEDSFFKVAKSPDGVFHPTLVLVGIRLGIDRVTPVYWEALKAALQMPESIGIAGGRPSASHYFVGTQGSFFFYLDPHFVRPALPLREDVSSYTAEEINSCHTCRLRRIHISEMDPSMLIAFLIRTEEDWPRWREGVASVQGKAVILVADNEPKLHHGHEREDAIDEVQTFDDDDEDL